MTSRHNEACLKLGAGGGCILLEVFAVAAPQLFFGSLRLNHRHVAGKVLQI